MRFYTGPRDIVEDIIIGAKYEQAVKEAKEIAKNAGEPCPVTVEPDCRRTEQDAFEKEHEIAPGCGYYRRRHNEFLKRYPGRQPPSYYLEYGEKYCNRFTRETYDKLSDKGKKWFDGVKCDLQKGIESTLRDTTKLHKELMNKEFNAEAFGMHAGVYLDNELAELDFWDDQWNIGWTPKEEFLPWKENFLHTMGQVGAVLPKLIPKWEERRREAVHALIPDEEWLYFLP